jgi:isoquinoline 1-oxidoreductase beta subunit
MREGKGMTEQGITRRTMVGWLIAGPTLIAGGSLGRPSTALAKLPTIQPVDAYDLSDLLKDSTRATWNLVTVEVRPDGTVHFDLPRSENGQGLTTSFGMIVADELDVSLDKVQVTLADAQPDLQFNQFTGGSASTIDLYEPVRQACAAARQRMLEVASDKLEVPLGELTIDDGVISGRGRSITYGELSTVAAVSKTRRSTAKARVKRADELKLVGRPHRRTDARRAVTGQKPFAMDLDIPGALPTMLCRAPTINGNAEALLNRAEIEAMPGVEDVQVIPRVNTTTLVVNGGVAVRAQTFGQCIDAIRKMKVRWSAGTAAGKSADTVLADLRGNELPMVPAAGTAIEEEFVFHFRPGDPLETNCAVADVREDSAEIWAPLKSPIAAQRRIATNLQMPGDKVKVHVTEGGGSFGRHLFSDGAMEAAHVSRAFGNKPVRLMWSRADGPRQGRNHPMCVVRNRATHDGSQVTTFSQRFTSVATDYTMGFGEILSAVAATPPLGNLGYAQTVYNLTANVPYDFGIVDMAINEIYEYNTFNTSSVRNIYSPEMRTSIELLVDQIAIALKKDPLEFRLETARDARMRAVIERVKKESNWGRAMKPGTAQGIGVHREYKGFAACVVEVDARAKTVNRTKVGGKTGPRVTRATYVVDVGLPINPLGLQAQMMGGIMDGIGQVFTYCLHLKDGAFLEASWDNAFYTRQWNVPPRLDVHIMPANQDLPGGAGEFGVAASMAATACAYSRAVGKMQTVFPVGYDDLGFTPYPFVPPIPASPKNGLKYRNAPKQHH